MVFIPKGRETDGSLSFSIKGTINLSVFVDAKVVDLQSVLFIQFSVELPSEITAGEYEYSLTDAAGIISTGLLEVDDLSSVSEYNLSVEYEQYQ